MAPRSVSLTSSWTPELLLSASFILLLFRDPLLNVLPSVVASTLSCQVTQVFLCLLSLSVSFP